MADVCIYVSSDGLIEVDGDIQAEFDVNTEDEGNFLIFSDGTVLSVTYTNEGIWRINPRVTGAAYFDITFGTDPDDDYTDKITLKGADIRWVVFGSQFVKANHVS